MQARKKEEEEEEEEGLEICVCVYGGCERPQL